MFQAMRRGFHFRLAKTLNSVNELMTVIIKLDKLNNLKKLSNASPNLGPYGNRWNRDMLYSN